MDSVTKASTMSQFTKNIKSNCEVMQIVWLDDEISYTVTCYSAKSCFVEISCRFAQATFSAYFLGPQVHTLLTNTVFHHGLSCVVLLAELAWKTHTKPTCEVDHEIALF